MKDHGADALVVTRYTGLQVSPKVGRSGANIAETVIIAVALEPWLVLKMAPTSHAKNQWREMPVLWKSAVIAGTDAGLYQNATKCAHQHQ